MRDVLIYLAIATLLLIGALGAVYYVWDRLQSLPDDTKVVGPKLST